MFELKRSYLQQLEQKLKLEFPRGFPIYYSERNAPNIDAPPRVIWFPTIGEIKEPSLFTTDAQDFDSSGDLWNNDDSNPLGEPAQSISRDIVAERQIGLAFEIWGEDDWQADLLVGAVYARLKRIIPQIVRAQEQWLRDDQQTSLGRMVTLLITTLVPLADDDTETDAVLASVAARVRPKKAISATPSEPLEPVNNITEIDPQEYP
jgi:hypothetical protein